jgi:subtilisin family serine protease
MRRWIASASAVVLLAVLPPAGPPAARAAERRVAEDAASVREVAKRKQRVRVIARLKRHDPAGTVSEHALRGRMAGAGVAWFERLGDLPHVALEVDERQLDALVASGEVEQIRRDRKLRPRLAESVPLVGAPAAWGRGARGDGQVVAILDTGVDGAHPFLRGKVLQEACFSSTVRTDRAASLCRGARPSGVGIGAAAPCPITVDGCHHGTHVAGIVAGEGPDFSGVAPGARIVSVQVYSRVADAETCGYAGAECVVAYESDLIRGLNHVRSLAGRYRIAAANLSLSDGPEEGGVACDDEPIKAAIDALRARGIATVVAAGNDYADGAVGYPGCPGLRLQRDHGGLLDRFRPFRAGLLLLQLLPGRGPHRTGRGDPLRRAGRPLPGALGHLDGGAARRRRLGRAQVGRPAGEREPDRGPAGGDGPAAARRRLQAGPAPTRRRPRGYRAALPRADLLSCVRPACCP